MDVDSRPPQCWEKCNSILNVRKGTEVSKIATLEEEVATLLVSTCQEV
jgi:hypothetical protein